MGSTLGVQWHPEREAPRLRLSGAVFYPRMKSVDACMNVGRSKSSLWNHTAIRRFFDICYTGNTYDIMFMLKQFLQWISLKEKLHQNSAKPPFVAERDIWWMSFGENIGSEINGKSSLFSRPGIVLKKLAQGFYLVAPTTTQERSGTWYVEMMYNGKRMFVCLHQIRAVDYRRLSSRMGRINEDDFRKVKKSFIKLYQ